MTPVEHRTPIHRMLIAIAAGITGADLAWFVVGDLQGVLPTGSDAMVGIPAMSTAASVFLFTVSIAAAMVAAIGVILLAQRRQGTPRMWWGIALVAAAGVALGALGRVATAEASLGMGVQVGVGVGIAVAALAAVRGLVQVARERPTARNDRPRIPGV